VRRPRFRTLRHTGDVRLAAWGADERELIANAVAGIGAVALGRAPRGEARQWVEVEPWPAEPVRRLVRTLNLALFQLYTRRHVAVGFRAGARRARLGVAPLPASARPQVEIKAATFHALEVVERHGRLRAIVTLDL